MLPQPPGYHLPPTCELSAGEESTPPNSLQSPFVTRQPNAVSKGPGEGQKSTSQLQHFLDNVSMRILRTLC